MSGRNFSLTPHLSTFVDRQVDSGRHQNASEVVREALRRYEDDLEVERAVVAAIGALADQGAAAIERGDYRLISGPEDACALLADLERRADARPGLRD
jgi:antitoxin ParD1/3/4